MSIWDDILGAHMGQIVEDVKANMYTKSPITEIMENHARTSNLLWGNQTNKWETKNILTKWSNEA